MVIQCVFNTEIERPVLMMTACQLRQAEKRISSLRFERSIDPSTCLRKAGDGNLTLIFKVMECSVKFYIYICVSKFSHSFGLAVERSVRGSDAPNQQEAVMQHVKCLQPRGSKSQQKVGSIIRDIIMVLWASIVMLKKRTVGADILKQVKKYSSNRCNAPCGCYTYMC